MSVIKQIRLKNWPQGHSLTFYFVPFSR